MTSSTTLIGNGSANDDLLRQQAVHYPLVKALLERRSRRFGKGMHLNGGPLEYRSSERPEPLTIDEEAALAFAACGITGPITGEIPYETGKALEAGTGNVLTHLVGRTVGS